MWVVVICVDAFPFCHAEVVKLRDGMSISRQLEDVDYSLVAPFSSKKKAEAYARWYNSGRM